MSAPAVEVLLARLYTDEALRMRFLADPLAVAKAAGLSDAEAASFARIDRIELKLAADSYEHKRANYQGASKTSR